MATPNFEEMSQAELDFILDNVPVMQPPDDQESNFIDPPNQNGMSIAIMTICIAFVVLCLAVRVYARLILLKRIEAQEYLILGAFACFIGWSYCTLSLVPSPGYYVHSWHVLLRQTVQMGYCSIMVEWLGMFVSRGNRNWFFWACWIMITLQGLFALAIVIALNLACIPTKKKWEFWVPGKCINAHDIETVSATFQLVSDLIVLVLPQKAIWDLQMGWRKKAGVSVIFSLGVLFANIVDSACVSAAFRLAVTVEYAGAADAIYHIGPVCFWAYAEMTCGFIVVCVPCVPKILLESGVWRKIKKGFGMSVTGVTGATPKLQTGNSSAMRSKNMRSVSNSYLEIDETEMKNFQSESTEHLREGRDPHAAKNDKGIVRTTQVTVTQKEDKEDVEAMYGPQGQQWR